MSNSSIGLFDSGLGGLTIVKALSKLLPYENLLYLADQAHFPYGEKDPASCIEYSLRCAQILEKQDVKLIIIACHTASASALDLLQAHISIPVIGIIDRNSDLEKYKSVAILGTKSTIASKIYDSLIHTRTIPFACQEFVTLIENGMQNNSSSYAITKNVLKPLIGEIDAAFLACTHFPMMKNVIQKAFGESVTLIDPSESCAKRAFESLRNRSFLNPLKTTPTYQFITTGSLTKFRKLTQQFWNEKGGKKTRLCEILFKEI